MVMLVLDKAGRAGSAAAAPCAPAAQAQFKERQQKDMDSGSGCVRGQQDMIVLGKADHCSSAAVAP
jgi:hypothetical protein